MHKAHEPLFSMMIRVVCLSLVTHAEYMPHKRFRIQKLTLFVLGRCMQMCAEFGEKKYGTLLSFVERLSAGYPELRIEPELVSGALAEVRTWFDGVWNA